jgi:hypothetical protein
MSPSNGGTTLVGIVQEHDPMQQSSAKFTLQDKMKRKLKQNGFI